MTILAPDNERLSASLKERVYNELRAQKSLGTLKQFQALYQFLSKALESSDLNILEEQLISVIQYVLTDFSSKCSRPSVFIPISERTFWIDRVVPIFRNLRDQTGLVGFEWCETVAGEHVKSTIMPDTWKQGGVQYLDGRGYDREGRNRITMEASSGQNEEKLGHTLNDTIKNAQSSISMLNAVVRRNQHARFTTMAQLVTFSSQSVCKTLALTTTQLDQDKPGKYIVQQCRSAQVPTSFEERLNWFKVFEMISYLIGKMEDQTRLSLPQNPLLPSNPDP
ncbi:hypothetical protein BGX26_001657 [Mortierella sp. AD094]|nr:hypothetical protein BGX26_001657 [Mortierella sp. AD094]